MTTAQIAFALTIGAVVIAVVASLVSAERRERAAKNRGGAVHFEARALPRRLLSVVWGALAVLTVAHAAIRPDLFLALAACALALLAVREWNRIALRVGERALVHHPPNWIAPRSSAGAVALGSVVEADDVAGVAWIGHDNIGIRRKDGAIEAVFFRHRIARERHGEARDAVLAFLERACGSAEPPPLPVAGWTSLRASA